MLKRLQFASLKSGNCALVGVKLSLDPARVLDRQVISGEVAAGFVFALGPKDRTLSKLETVGSNAQGRGNSPGQWPV